MLNGKYTQWDDNVNHPTFYKIENLPTCDKGILTINEGKIISENTVKHHPNMTSGMGAALRRD